MNSALRLRRSTLADQRPNHATQRGCLLGFLLAALLPPGDTQAQRLPAFPFEQLPVSIRAVHSDKCLDVAGAGGADAPLQQFTCGDQENQTWFLIWVGGTDYQFRPGHRGNVRLAIANQSVADGAPAQLTNLELFGELFRFVIHNNDDTFEIVNKNSGKCLDVAGASTADGAAVQQQPCSGADNQRFRISARARPFHLIAKHSSKCVEVSGSRTDNGAPIEQSACLGSRQDNQDWIAEPAGTSGGTTSWTLRTEHSGKCLTAELESPSLSQADCTGSAVQRWSFVTNDDGFVQIVSLPTGACITVAGASLGDGATVQTLVCTGNDEQRFFWSRNVRRHLLVVHPATSAGTDRYVSVSADMVSLVARANAIYRRYGIELVYDPLVDVLAIDNDALHNLGDVNAWPNTYACMNRPRVPITATPERCAARYGRLYSDRIVIVIGPGNAAGFSNGEQRFIFYRATDALGSDPCGLGTLNNLILPHEVGHYFGLSHVVRGSYMDGLAAGSALANNGNNAAIFDGDNLSDTYPDPSLPGTGCLAPTQPIGWVWTYSYSGLFLLYTPFPIQTDNIMSPPYFNLNPTITLQQAEIVRGTAYANGL